MAIKVMLMQTIPELGTEGAVVRVAEGYARNFLFPKRLAELVTPAASRRLEKLKREREAADKALAAEAAALAQRLAGVSVTLPVKTSDGEHLYGSVAAADIVAALEAQGFTVDKLSVEIPEPIKELGVYEVKISLAAGQETTIKTWVVEE
ncbi:MAG: 50S ribosomal protein L9 [Kiritimatiellia bacterium]